MSPSVTHIVGLFLVPVVGHFDRRALILALVADEGVGETTFRVLVLTQNLHAQDTGIKIQGFFLIEHANHRVIESKVRFLIVHHLPLFSE